jgi:hypothetical protein
MKKMSHLLPRGIELHCSCFLHPVVEMLAGCELFRLATTFVVGPRIKKKFEL